MTPTNAAGPADRSVLWRVVVDGPVMLGGLAVVVLVAGSLGTWAPALPLAWLALAALWLTRLGERLAVRVAYGYRRMTLEQVAQLRDAVELAAARTAASIAKVDVYVRLRTEDSVNAYAAGRRSIAVSQGLLAAAGDGRLTVNQVAALVTHEVGHLQARQTRYGLAIAWLGVPWRAVMAMLGGLLRVIVGKVPTARAGLVVLGPVVVVVAVVQGVQQRAWAPLAAMVVVGLLLVVQPLAAAALSRSSEQAADAFAARCGLGPDLAAALAALDDGSNRVRCAGWDSHPARAHRIRALSTVGASPRA